MRIMKAVISEEEYLNDADDWSNEEYFSYMKETGNWEMLEENPRVDEPCDRCGESDLTIWKLQAMVDVAGSFSVGTEFDICTLCLLELHGASYAAESTSDITCDKGQS